MKYAKPVPKPMQGSDGDRAANRICSQVLVLATQRTVPFQGRENSIENRSVTWWMRMLAARE